MKTRKILALVLAIVTLFSCFGVVAFAEEESTTAYLDTDTNISKTIDQNYSLSTETGDYTDVTKVQVSWALTNISATVKMNKIWDTEKLEWVDDTSTATAENVTATFNFKNLSSVKVNAQVEFAAATGITAEPKYTDNVEEAKSSDGQIILNSKAIDANADITGEVVVYVPADKDFFKTVKENKVDAIYGIYTITIRDFGKKMQNAPDIPSIASATASSVTLNAIDEGYGTTEYVYSEIDEVPETGWVTTTTFSDLDPTKTYYFFARYTGNDEYNEAVSEGKAFKIYCTVTVQRVNSFWPRIETKTWNDVVYGSVVDTCKPEIYNYRLTIGSHEVYTYQFGMVDGKIDTAFQFKYWQDCPTIVTSDVTIIPYYEY